MTSARSTAEFQPFACHVPGQGCALAAPLAPCNEPLHDWANEHARMLQLAEDTDFLELSVVEPNGDPRGVVTPDQLGVWAKAGSECAGATDRLACIKALTEAKLALRQEHTCDGNPCSKPPRLFGVYTRGDRVQKLRTAADLRGLLGAIDTPVEAWLMLMIETGQPYFACNDATTSKHRKIGANYQLVSLNISHECTSPKPRGVHREFTYSVDAAGAVKRTQAAVVAVTKGCPALGDGVRPQVGALRPAS